MGTGETVAVKQIKLADLPKSELRVITVCSMLSGIEKYMLMAITSFSWRSTSSRIWMYVMFLMVLGINLCQ